MIFHIFPINILKTVIFYQQNLTLQFPFISRYFSQYFPLCEPYVNGKGYHGGKTCTVRQIFFVGMSYFPAVNIYGMHSCTTMLSMWFYGYYNIGLDISTFF